MRIITLDALGADKGTQVEKIAVKYQIPHISTGDIFRANIKNDTELGMKAKSHMDTGGLVSDETTIDMLLDCIHEEDCKSGYVLGGFPKTIPQAESLMKALGDTDEAIDYVTNVDVPDESIINRMSGRRACLSCGVTCHIVYSPPKKERICDVCGQQLALRDDDKSGTVRKRPDIYHGQTQPPIGYYKKTGTLAEVDGTLDVEKAFQVIVRILRT